MYKTLARWHDGTAARIGTSPYSEARAVIACHCLPLSPERQAGQGWGQLVRSLTC